VNERRKYERFTLRLPSKIEVRTSDNEHVLDLLTSDVSAGGAFFCTTKSIPQGTQVTLGLTLASRRLKELTAAQALINVKGTVVRCNAKGMAVSFNEDYEIVNLPVLRTEQPLA
jgi:hypothetical protein